MRLRFRFKSNVVIVVSVLHVCADVEDEETPRKIHSYIVKVGLDFQVIVGNASLFGHFSL